MSRSSEDRLRDIQTAIARVHEYRASLSGSHARMALSAILRDSRRHWRSRHAPPETITAAKPEILWRQIASMRNFLVHEYFNIDEAVVEDVIVHDLDPLHGAVTELLSAKADADSQEK